MPKVSEVIRIASIGFQRAKDQSFIRGIHDGFVVILAVDLEPPGLFIRLFGTSYLFRKDANRILEEHRREFVEALSTEVPFRWEPAKPRWQPPNYGYSMDWYDLHLQGFLDTLSANKEPTLIVLGLRPSEPRWLISMSTFSQNDISSIVDVYYRNTTKVSPGLVNDALGGRLLRPVPVMRFRLPQSVCVDSLAATPVSLSSYPLAQPAEPRVVVGKVNHPITGLEIGEAALELKSLSRHVGIHGTTGTGKTSAALVVLDQAYRHGINYTCFAWKNDLRCLQTLHGASVYDYAGRNPLRIALLKPIGHPGVWATTVINSIVEASSGAVAGTGMESVLREEITEEFRQCGVYEGKNPPSIFAILDRLETRLQQLNPIERERNWLVSAAKLLRSLASDPIRQSFDTATGVNIGELLNRPVVIELEGLGSTLAKFIVSFLLDAIRQYRVSQGLTENLKHVILIDEAHRLVPERLQSTNTIVTAFLESRGLGEGLIVCSQLPHKLSVEVLANLNTNIVFRLIPREDHLVACNLTAMDIRHAPFFERLKVGEAILRTDHSYLVKVTPFEKKPLSDDQIRIEKPPVREDIATDFARRQDVANKAEDLSALEWSVLRALGLSVACNQSRLSKELRVNGKMIGKVMAVLINGKHLVRYTWAESTESKPTKLLFLSPHGEEAARQHFGDYLDKIQAKAEPHPNHGDLKERVKKAIGLPTVPKERFDLVFEGIDGHQFPVEIETGSNKAEQQYENARKSVDAFGHARFVVTGATTYNSVLQQGARYSFDSRQGYQLHLISIEDLEAGKPWTIYTFRPGRQEKKR